MFDNGVLTCRSRRAPKHAPWDVLTFRDRERPAGRAVLRESSSWIVHTPRNLSSSRVISRPTDSRDKENLSSETKLYFAFVHDSAAYRWPLMSPGPTKRTDSEAMWFFAVCEQSDRFNCRFNSVACKNSQRTRDTQVSFSIKVENIERWKINRSINVKLI